MRTFNCSFHSTLQNQTNFDAFLFRTRNEAKELIDATNQKTNNTQNEVTERLGGRVQDISYWKFELERAISDISAENDLMVQEIRRLEYAVQATDVPKNIANDCLGNLPEHSGFYRNIAIPDTHFSETFRSLQALLC